MAVCFGRDFLTRRFFELFVSSFVVYHKSRGTFYNELCDFCWRIRLSRFLIVIWYFSLVIHITWEEIVAQQFTGLKMNVAKTKAGKSTPGTSYCFRSSSSCSFRECSWFVEISELNITVRQGQRRKILDYINKSQWWRLGEKIDRIFWGNILSMNAWVFRRMISVFRI